MRQLVYYIAGSLDGFIAREDGSFDDFPWDDEFVAHLMESYPETLPAPMRPDARREENRRFDTVLMGRHTYQVGLDSGLTSPYPTLDQFVLSTTLGTSPDPDVEVVSRDGVDFVERLKALPGKDVWICGGSSLATPLYHAGLIDRVILKLNPVVFGAGIPLFRERLANRPLVLESMERFPSGHVILDYAVAGKNRSGN